MKRSMRETLVVVFVLVGIGLAILAYFWFSGRIETGRRRNVTVYFQDVTGLRVGDPVEVQGLPKGKVVGLELKDGRIRCRVALDRDVGLTEDTRFAIRSVSYLGSDRYLMVTLGSGPAMCRGFEYSGANEALDLENTFLKMDRLLGQFDPAALGSELKQAGQEMMATVKAELARLGAQLDRFNQSFTLTADELAGLSAGLDSLAALLKPGSTASELLSSGELYNDVRNTNRQLQELLSDIRKNPKRYFKLSLF